MKVKISTVYLVLFVLGVIAAGVITGVYGNEIGIWISYSFLAAYGIMIIVNAVMTEKIASVKVETYDDKKITAEQIKDLPDKLGEGEEKVVGESTLEELDLPPEPPQEIKEEPKKVQLTEEQTKMANNIVKYINENLKKGHKLDKIKAILEKAYTKEFIDFVLQNTVAKEPELPDMGEPEDSVTPETLNAEITENKEQHEATANLKKTKEGVKCPKCGKSCKSKGSLKNHQRLSKKCQS